MPSLAGSVTRNEADGVAGMLTKARGKGGGGKESEREGGRRNGYFEEVGREMPVREGKEGGEGGKERRERGGRMDKRGKGKCF